MCYDLLCKYCNALEALPPDSKVAATPSDTFDSRTAGASSYCQELVLPCLPRGPPGEIAKRRSRPDRLVSGDGVRSPRRMDNDAKLTVLLGPHSDKTAQDPACVKNHPLGACDSGRGHADGDNQGVKRVVLDGKVLDGAHVPLLRDGGGHQVQVEMG
jgi:hypothetical protein